MGIHGAAVMRRSAAIDRFSDFQRYFRSITQPVFRYFTLWRNEKE